MKIGMRAIGIGWLTAAVLTGGVDGSSRDGNPAATAAAAGEGLQQRGAAEATDRVSRTVRLAGNGRISLSNRAGSIRVTGGAGDQVVIEAVKRTQGDRRLLDEVQIDIEERGGRLDISTDYPNRRRSDRGGSLNGRRESVAVDYTLTVPAQSSIEIESAAGPIGVSNVSGTVSIESVSGDVNLSGLSRLAEVETISGRIELVDSTLAGDAELSSVSGGIMLRNVNAQSLRVQTISGRIATAGNISQRLEMSSVSGSLDLTGVLARNGRYSLESHSGSVRLALSGDTGFELDANSFSGSVRSEFPARLAQQSSRDSRGRSRGSRAMRASYGDGSATLDIQTFSGSITLERR